MGLFSSLFGGRRAGVAENVWYPDGDGVSDGGDCGGDIQAGESFSVRFFNDADPEAVVIITTYAAEYDKTPGEYRLQVQVEWWLCDDRESPAPTEQWCDSRYFDMGAYRDAETATDDAEAVADSLADGLTDDALAGLPGDTLDTIFRWDGSPASVAAMSLE